MNMGTFEWKRWFAELSSSVRIRKLYILNLVSTNSLPALNVISALILTPILLDTLGKSFFGIWVLLQSIIYWFNLARFGFNTTLVRDLAAIKTDPDKKDQADVMVSSTFWTSTGIVVVLAILIITLSMFASDIFNIEKDKQAVSIITFNILFVIFAFNFISIPFNSLLYANELYYQKNFIVAGGIILSTLLVLVVFPGEGTILSLAKIYLLVAFLEFAFLCLLVYRNWKFIPSMKVYNFNVIKKMFRPSMGYFLISISALLIFRSDSFVIAYFVSTEALAVYFIAYRLVDQVVRIIWNVSDILLPNISASYHSGDIFQLRATFKKMLLLTVGMTLIAAAGLFLLGQWFLRIWVGPENVVEFPVLCVFIITAFVQSIAHSCGVFINAIGKHKPIVWFSGIEAILNVGLSILLVRQYGYLGVALGTLIAHLLCTGWFSIYHSFKELNRAGIKGENIIYANRQH